MDELGTYAENTWCSGCGNFGILTAAKKAFLKLEERGISRDKIFYCVGIGCHAKMFDYINLSSFYSLHGRDMATAEGIKFANPDLKVVTFAGDGDALGEGLEHVIFAAKRNANFSLIMHNNGVYALTLGQFSPVAKKGWKGPSSPSGSVEEPLNALPIMLEAGATFVARGYTARIPQLVDLIVQAMEHKGFAFVDVLQPCVSWNNTYDLYNKITEVLDHEPKTYEESMSIAKRKDKLPLGVIYRAQKPVFNEELYGAHNPSKMSMSREERIEKIKKILEP